MSIAAAIGVATRAADPGACGLTAKQIGCVEQGLPDRALDGVVTGTQADRRFPNERLKLVTLSRPGQSTDLRPFNRLGRG